MKQNKVDYFVLTQVITDDIYEAGACKHRDVLGGGAYAAAGLRIWSEHVGFCSGAGADYPELGRGWFPRNGVDFAPALRPLPCARSRINYFPDGEREEIPTPGTGSLDLMQPHVGEIPPEYGYSKGMYFFKDCDPEFWEDMTIYLKEHPNLCSVWEIFGATASPENREVIRGCLEKVDLFSINRTEGRRLTGETDPIRIVDGLLALHAKALIFRMGPDGAMVSDGKGIWHVPAAPCKVVDVTGGGNSSTGGFLAGWCESGGDPVQAGVWAAVSSSLILEQFGVPDPMDEALHQEALRRAQALTPQVRRLR